MEHLVALRTAPVQSFLNPVEKIMSNINLALQHVDIERPNCSDKVEALLCSCGTFDSIRQKEADIRDE